MSYDPILNRRISYDIDGTVIGWNKVSLSTGPTTWLTSAEVIELNDYNNTAVISTSTYSQDYIYFWCFFPEKKEINLLKLLAYASGSGGIVLTIEGSNDTTNGIDGTWETATISNITSNAKTIDLNWWVAPGTISFSTAYKVIRFQIHCYGTSGGAAASIRSIHLYGKKGVDQTPDDILFCDTDNNELTSLINWGDRPESSSLIKSFKIKNASASKTANDIVLTTSGSYTLSLDQSTWSASLTIATLAAGGVSPIIYIKDTIGAPNQTLGPRQNKVTSVVTSWT